MRIATCRLLEKRVPSGPSEYRLLAEQCKRLASQAEDEQYRLLLMRVAARWSELADQAEVDKKPAKNLDEKRQMRQTASTTVRRRMKG